LYSNKKSLPRKAFFVGGAVITLLFLNSFKYMKIGIPKEIKTAENRVALTPAGARELTKRGNEVFVETGAGVGSGFHDKEFVDAGAKIITSHEQVFANAEMIVKVKEPLSEEFALIKDHHIVFTYFHFASSIDLTKAMIASNSVCIAYETVENPDKTLPLLTPMSEIAGRMSIQEGAKYLEKQFGGRGVLLAGVPGVSPGNVMILGAGVVGFNAALMAAGLGANVTILDINISRLRQIDSILPANVNTLYSSDYNISEAVKRSDLIIGAVLIPGAKAPVLINREMLKLMKPGTVVIDVAVDQGGCIETCHPTTHDNPVYIIDDIVHYCVANMPGAVPYTSTLALTNATLPYIIQLASKGWNKASGENREILTGLNIVKGGITYRPLAETFDLPFHPAEKYLK
jgi:alanine dehydrogenase